MTISNNFGLGDVKGTTVDGVQAASALQGFAGQVGALARDNPLQVVLAYLIAQLPSLTSASGNASAVLHSGVPLDAVATLATATVSGSAYAGPLANFDGVSVAPSPISFDSGGSPIASTTEVAWVLDFNGVRKIERLFVTDSSLTIALVLPWMGTEWGGKSLFPLTAPGFDVWATPSPSDSPASDAAFPEAETAKVLVQFASAATEQDVLTHLNIRSKTRPRNVQVAVGDRPPFFVHPEVLSAPVPLADFAGEVNSYLDAVRQLGATGAVPVVLQLTTDAPGVLSLDQPLLQFDRTASGSFGAGTARTFEFPVQGKQNAPLTFPASTSAAWHVKKLSFAMSNDLDRWQAFPREVGDIDPRRRAKVAPDLNVAQSFQMQTSMPLAGGALYMAAAANAELTLELYSDVGGQPAPASIASQAFSVPASDAPDWHYVELALPVSIDAGQPYWWVVKSSTGTATWVLGDAGDGSPVRFDRDGAGWRPLPGSGGSLAAVMRLLRGAAIDESPYAFELNVEGAQSAPAVTEEGGRIVLDFSTGNDGAPSHLVVNPQAGQVSMTLQINAHARGDLTLSDAQVQYEPIAAV